MKTGQFLSGANASPPTAPISPSVGYPSNGNPGTGTAATAPGAHWFYKIEQEIGAVITDGGLTQSDSDLTQLSQAIKNKRISLTGASTKLVITNNGSTPDSKLDITADEAVVKDANGYPVYCTSVSLTVDIAATGANGIDTGTEANSTWYAVWLIWNGTTKASLLSTSFSSPTMPSGYTHKSRVGAIYNNSSGNFIKIYQTGKKIAREIINVLSAGQASVAGTYQSKSVTEAIPPNATAIKGIIGSNHITTGNGHLKIAANSFGVGVAGGNGAPFNVANGLTPAANSEFTFNCLISTPQTIYWTQSDNGSATAMIYITEFEIY